jgi:hypothetical protein
MYTYTNKCIARANNMQTSTIFKHCAEVNNANYALLTAEQKQTLTQAEKCFIMQFLADTLQALTQSNTEVLAEESNFARYTDTCEVAENYVMLLKRSNCEFDNNDSYEFTIADAGTALCSYDTEYRDCITEQFEDACDEAAKVALQTFNTSADYSTLALRVIYAY